MRRKIVLLNNVKFTLSSYDDKVDIMSYALKNWFYSKTADYQHIELQDFYYAAKSVIARDYPIVSLDNFTYNITLSLNARRILSNHDFMNEFNSFFEENLNHIIVKLTSRVDVPTSVDVPETGI